MRHSVKSDVSVIIPTFNREQYVVQAIDSALNQSGGLSVEVIVVDDGSTDGTKARVGAYGDRVKYVYTNNGGCAHARNVGMAHATGRYLTFLDSDDVLYPYALEIEAAVLDANLQLGMVYAEMSGFDDSGFFERYHLKKYHSSAYRHPEVTYDRIFARSTPLAEAVRLPAQLLQDDPTATRRRAYFGRIFDRYLTNIIVFQNSLMMRREIIGTIGVRNVHVRYWEELDYVMRICRAYEVGFLDLPTYKLRYHPGQISTTAGEDGNAVWIRKQQALLRVIKRHAFADPDYYQRHRRRLDRHLANLHRAVAVPLLLAPASRQRASIGRRARAYLAGGARYGRAHWPLRMLSYSPPLLRQVGVSLIEKIRKAAVYRKAQLE
jgi:glycosyltransferase involved in cell wall biosynthesis